MLDQLIAGRLHDPHAVLGAHPVPEGTVIRTMRRRASSVSVVVGGSRYPMQRVHDEGVFEATVSGTVLDYRLDVDGTVVDDPYRPTTAAIRGKRKKTRCGPSSRTWRRRSFARC